MKKTFIKQCLGIVLLSANLSPVQAAVIHAGESYNNTPYYYVVGNHGSGGITVDAGDTFTWTGNPASPPNTDTHESGMIFARRTGSSGNGLISGPGSTINIVGNAGATYFQVGRGGTADLTIDNGGSLNVRDPNAIPNTASNNSTSLNVGGSGSNFPPTDGTGLLTADNGHILVEGNHAGLAIGNGGGNGTVNLTNGSTVTVVDHDLAGNSGTWFGGGMKGGSQGILNITDSTVNLSSDNNDAGMQVGKDGAGTNGSLNLSGPTARLDITAANAISYLNIGRNAGSFGQASVDGGAQINMFGDKSYFSVAREPGSIGTLSITNGGEVNVTGTTESAVLIGYARDLDNNPVTEREGGTGIVTVSGAGSSITAGDRIIVGAPLVLGGGQSSGTLIVTNGASVTTGQGVLVGLGGLFTGSAFVNGSVINDGGVIAPGDSPGTMTITGDYIQTAGGTLQMEVEGSGVGEYDVLNVLGGIDITEGIVEIIFSDSFLEELVADITLMPTLDDMFAAVGPKVMDMSLIRASAAGYQTVNIAFDDTGRLESIDASVPAPATLALMGLGLVGIGYRRKKLAA